MWQFLGTLAISAFGGTLVIHYLKNFLLTEKAALAWDWDGLIERTIITLLIVIDRWLFLIPVIIIVKVVFRLVMIGFFAGLFKTDEPGIVSQKVRLKAELALDLILSPLIAILTGIVF